MDFLSYSFNFTSVCGIHGLTWIRACLTWFSFLGFNTILWAFSLHFGKISTVLKVVAFKNILVADYRKVRILSFPKITNTCTLLRDIYLKFVPISLLCFVAMLRLRLCETQLFFINFTLFIVNMCHKQNLHLLLSKYELTITIN